MKIKFSLPSRKLCLEKLVAGIRTATDYERVVVDLEDGAVVDLEPGLYVVRPRQGKMLARFYVSYLGGLEGWFEGEPPDCVEIVK